MLVKRFITCCAALLSVHGTAVAQDNLFETSKKPARHGLMLGANGDFDFPAGDMAKRFGISYRLGPTLYYKTRSNWLIGVRGDFILGTKIKVDSLMANIKDDAGTLINQDGQRLGINVWERGYKVGFEVGKIINMSRFSGDNGLMLLTSVGFLEHKITIQDKGESIVSVRGDYRKGYDRLTNGIYAEQYIGYLYLSDNGLINFHVGLDVMWGFTQGRRNYWFDVRQPGTDKRNDILFGVRAGWILPMFKRKSEEFYFE
jgi:hypothetical protein